MSIKQFNGEWVMREDRILFRFSTSDGKEFRFWLTRHVVRNLIQGCQQLEVQMLSQSHPQDVAQAMQEFKQQSTSQQMNFSQAYESQPERPLGEEPALVIGLRIDQTGNQVSLDLETAAGHNVNLRITDEVLRMMVGLLDKIQLSAGWSSNEASEAQVAVTRPTPASPHIH